MNSNLFNMYLSTYCIPGTDLRTEDLVVKRDQNPFLCGLHSVVVTINRNERYLVSTDTSIRYHF